MSAADPRQRILQAAGEVFAEKGFKETTVREICRAAGVNLASVNYYFGDKEHLYVEVVRLAHPDGPETGEEPWPEKASPETRLRLYIRRFVERLFGAEAQVWKLRLLQREILNPTPACREIMQTYFRARFGQLQEILDDILPQGTPEHRRHQIGLSIIGQCVYFHAAAPVVRLVLSDEEYQAHFGAEELAEHVSRLCLAALGLAPPLAEPPASHG